MLPLRDATRTSLRHSRNREACLLAYLARGRLAPPDVARETGLRRGRVFAALQGELPDYASERSLVGLGLVRPVVTRFGVEHELTDHGVAEAEAIAALRAAGRAV